MYEVYEVLRIKRVDGAHSILGVGCIRFCELFNAHVSVE